jgi:hypothetical protein
MTTGHSYVRPDVEAPADPKVAGLRQGLYFRRSLARRPKSACSHFHAISTNDVRLGASGVAGFSPINATSKAGPTIAISCH